ncbi:MAG: glycosidase [Armatimonadota bacterium]
MEHCPFRRHESNPIITLDDLAFEANGVFNPGVTMIDGETILLLRIERREGISELRVARSENGVDNWKIADEALLEPDLPQFPYEEWGCEDPRITLLEDGRWAIAYAAYGRYGPTVAIAVTDDFETCERLGTVTMPPNKDAALFPCKFDGRWLMVNRPETSGSEQIWYSFSDEDRLADWMLPGLLIPTHLGPWWDAERIGAGAPPIRTDEGWLLIYHGAKAAAGGMVYRLGVVLLDLDDPRKVIARARNWVLAPREPYEIVGIAQNVVFTCGASIRDDEVWMYYGAADTCVGLAIAKLTDLVQFVLEHNFLDEVGRDKGMAF